MRDLLRKWAYRLARRRANRELGKLAELVEERHQELLKLEFRHAVLTELRQKADAEGRLWGGPDRATLDEQLPSLIKEARIRYGLALRKYQERHREEIIQSLPSSQK